MCIYTHTYVCVNEYMNVVFTVYFIFIFYFYNKGVLRYVYVQTGKKGG